MKGRLSATLAATILALTVAAVLTSCLPENLVWTGTYNFPGGRWNRLEKVTFTPDTAFLNGEARKGTVSLRYGDKASAERLPVVMETECPATGVYQSDTLMISLLPGDRRTADNARLGVFETTDTISLAVKTLPGWTVTFYPATEDEISGIYSITLELIK